MDDEKLRRMSYRSHFWRYMQALLGVVSAIVALVYLFFGDAEKTARVWHNLTGLTTESRASAPEKAAGIPALRLRLSSPWYRVGDSFGYSFSSSRAGYVSLWNINARGRAERVFPAATAAHLSLFPAGRKYIAGRDGLPTFEIAGAPGPEQLVLIWCPRAMDHGIGTRFHNRKAFEHEVTRTRLKGCFDTRADYEIRPASR